MWVDLLAGKRLVQANFSLLPHSQPTCGNVLAMYCRGESARSSPSTWCCENTASRTCREHGQRGAGRREVNVNAKPATTVSLQRALPSAASTARHCDGPSTPLTLPSPALAPRPFPWGCGTHGLCWAAARR